MKYLWTGLVVMFLLAALQHNLGMMAEDVDKTIILNSYDYEGKFIKCIEAKIIADESLWWRVVSGGIPNNGRWIYAVKDEKTYTTRDCHLFFKEPHNSFGEDRIFYKVYSIRGEK